MHLQLTQTEGLLTIRMARAKANALNSELLQELRDAIGNAGSDAAIRGVVLASALPGIFSAGFDAREIFPFGPDEIKVFFGSFLQLTHGIMNLAKPVVAAVEGHAIAGGAILALACDARVMADGDYGFALNEINLGLVISAGLLQMAVAAVGGGRAGVDPGRRRHQPTAGALYRTVLRAGASRGGLAARRGPRPQSHGEASAGVRGGEAPLPATLVPASGKELQSLETFVQHWSSAESTECRKQLAASLRR